MYLPLLRSDVGGKPNYNQLTLFLTNSCTLHCAYCYASAGKSHEQMPWPLAKASLDFALRRALERENKVAKLAIHGGDVGACWPLFVKTVEYFKDRCRRLGLKGCAT